ncbi:predicted protein [Sclerotinia sclerotiorum 1980 UF-70]|uniref:Uncharacterized protein n=1 Tax=Sclerotinia sclerotiorum (strain ATCC 18683 / 1980 / Ss-1) TaxID=665079 RepID=A7E880_SCLS1|nr:predicted protein [Sclerotinia sclerotiorum 1980 UF-70]EDN96582.1 predicted protein [Sclerotinia sclerotiorum 1980 UF-70]
MALNPMGQSTNESDTTPPTHKRHKSSKAENSDEEEMQQNEGYFSPPQFPLLIGYNDHIISRPAIQWLAPQISMHQLSKNTLRGIAAELRDL